MRRWLRYFNRKSNDEKKPFDLERLRFRLRMFYACLLTITIHLVAVFIFSDFFKPTLKAQKAPEIKYLNTKLVAPQKPQELKKEVPNKKEKKQVVSVPLTNPQERPDEADFMGELDQKTNKETKSRDTSKEPETLSQQPSFSPPSLPNQQQVAPKEQGKKSKKLAEEGQKKEKQRNDADGNQETPPHTLVPSWKELAQVKGMPFSDSLDNVKTGAETSLNVWQWKHASFFNRIKESVARAWNPQLEIQKHDPSGRSLGRQDRRTIVKVVIDRAGRLKELDVEKGSGVSFLDNESLRAFRVAAPFNNPPPALFEGRESFAFDFGFQVSFERGFEFDFNWRSN